MYIRRKVFSNIQVNESEVKTFSTTEYELDENLEARIFSNDETKEKIKKAAKVGGIAAGTAVGAGAAGIYGAKGLGKLVEKEGIKAILDATTTKERAEADKVFLTGLKMQKAADAINKKVAAGAQGVAEKSKAAVKAAKRWLTNAEAVEAAEKYKAAKLAKGVKGAALKNVEKKAAEMTKAASKTALGRKIAAGTIAAGVLAAGAAGGAKAASKKKSKSAKK
jgi:hypothetical protein